MRIHFFYIYIVSCETNTKDEEKGNDGSCETEKGRKSLNGSSRRRTKYRNTKKEET